MRLMLVRLSLVGLTVVLATVMAQSARGQAGYRQVNNYPQAFTPNPYYNADAPPQATAITAANPEDDTVAPPPLAGPGDQHSGVIPPYQIPSMAAPQSTPRPRSRPAIPPPSRPLIPPPPSTAPPASSTLPPSHYPVLPAPTAEMVPNSTVLEEPSVLPPTEEVLQQESYGWWNPWIWFPRDGWNNSIEFGINGTEGNSRSFSFLTGADLNRATKQHELQIDFNYLKTSASGETTQHNAFFGSDYDYLLADSNWSAFTKLGLEYDEFKAFDLRLNTNTGLGYYWVRTKQSKLVTRIGAGASREFDGPNNAWSPEAVFGVETEEQITESQRVSAKIEYFPEWGNFSDYRLVTDVAWESLLGGSENLSLKIAATDRIDSTPEGRKPNDVNYSLLLLYKF